LQWAPRKFVVEPYSCRGCKHLAWDHCRTSVFSPCCWCRQAPEAQRWIRKPHDLLVSLDCTPRGACICDLSTW